MEQLSSSEFLEISRELERHHAIFYKFWQLGKPWFVDDTNTAYVQFDERGETILFGISKKFWEKCSPRKRAFIICHECLHVIYNHGSRMGSSDKQGLMANIAADIVINHELIRTFGFRREEIEGWKKGCWIDTVFKGQDISDKENMDYYYALLKKQSIVVELPGLMDDHSNFGCKGENGDKGNDGGWVKTGEGSKAIAERLQDELTPQELESLRETLTRNEQINGEAGSGAGGMWKFMAISYVKPKRKWETVIKNWCLKHIRNASKDTEQWARTNRRFIFVDKELILPTEMEIDDIDQEKDKIKVWFFLDTSGSCAGLANRFWKAALSLPEDRFDVQLYCFDTRVYEVDKKTRKLHGFGGTSFGPIEGYIQRNCEGKYPKAVFLITDGYGSSVNPQYPERWYWFLSCQHKQYIPAKSKVFPLSQFE